jgi:hypothetical protein
MFHTYVLLGYNSILWLHMIVYEYEQTKYKACGSYCVEWDISYIGYKLAIRLLGMSLTISLSKQAITFRLETWIER